eukprot:366043-Chlamydomonas_euryale.AAC.3
MQGGAFRSTLTTSAWLCLQAISSALLRGISVRSCKSAKTIGSSNMAARTSALPWRLARTGHEKLGTAWSISACTSSLAIATGLSRSASRQALHTCTADTLPLLQPSFPAVVHAPARASVSSRSSGGSNSKGLLPSSSGRSRGSAATLLLSNVIAALGETSTSTCRILATRKSDGMMVAA